MGRTIMRLALIQPATAAIVLLLSALLSTAAGQPEKVSRIGYLNPGSPSDPLRQRRLDVFRQGMRELGYVDGQNIAIESRWAEGQNDRYPALAADLVRSKLDVIVVQSGAATQAVQQATRTIPIVMSLVVDPVGSGLVASLAHPGGNVTGTTVMATDLAGKTLQLLKEMVPKISRVAVLRHPVNPGSASFLREAEPAARILGIRLQLLEARDPQGIDSAFTAMARERAGALLVFPDAFFGTHRRQVAELALKRRLPSIFPTGSREYVEAGGLMIYGPNLVDLERRLATYVDKILKGTKPGDLPVEQPTKFEMVVNVRTAKAIGLTISPLLLQCADQLMNLGGTPHRACRPLPNCTVERTAGSHTLAAAAHRSVMRITV